MRQEVKRLLIQGCPFDLVVARTNEQIERGLADREVGEGEGMLFVFDREEVQHFWMLGCIVPLDVAFIGRDGRVTAIHTMPVSTEPTHRMPSYTSESRCAHAIEVPAGTFERIGLAVGDTISGLVQNGE